MLNTTIYGIYDDDDVLLSAVNQLRSKGVKIQEVFTPFPVHGLDKALGLKRTRMGIVSFLFGLAGLSFGLWMTWYMMISDWPVNIGGKPNAEFHKNVPSFVPVLFEMSVLCAAHGMVITFLLRGRIIPGRRNKNPFPETTDDKFAVQIDATSRFSRDEVHALLRKSGATQVKEID
jgi:hypothetical protein